MLRVQWTVSINPLYNEERQVTLLVIVFHRKLCVSALRCERLYIRTHT